MSAGNFNIQGLNSEQVMLSRTHYGMNRLEFKKANGFIDAAVTLLKEPMVVLLLAAAALYFISGNTGDGIFMGAAIVLVAGISLYQDARSRNALAQLKNITQPNCTVIRNGTVCSIPTEELVIGDSLMIEEGTAIAADGTIIHSNDFSVNESVLTGESLSVYKDISKENPHVFRGTTVTSGLAIVTVTAIGNNTKLGAIGKSIESIQEEKTPLEKQINNFVKKMVLVGAIVFFIVWGINYTHSHKILDSLLKALTLAMSILPEEIPVAFTTFMALGAWRLMKMGIVVKQMKTVETLGSATVICTDKTGTLTENQMSLARIFCLTENKISLLDKDLTTAEKELIRLAMFASEPIPFDPMEIALHDAYTKIAAPDDRLFYKMIHEYPLGGKPPMMTHIFEDTTGHRIIAAKGAPEAIIQVATLTNTDREKIISAIDSFTIQGYRVLAVGSSGFIGNNFPKTQQDFTFALKGIIAFYDPPKTNIKNVLQQFYAAGISVKIVTGDNSATTAAIAKEINFNGTEKIISGDELMLLSQNELSEKVLNTQIFTRMFPEAKLKIINALKEKKEIVAMTGDGVNDGPALKAAHIGIAMGKKGTEIAKQAASLILVEDDLSKMLDAIAIGRKIYTNLKKAIRYIISIHIPIILTVFIPLVLGWRYPNIFSPVHIIFLELIMGPTCSIIYENEPMEANTMLQSPRPFSTTFFNWRELTISVVQGLMITLGCLLTYQYAVTQSCSESATRTLVFITLITANIFLTLINRSFYYSILTTLRYRNNLVLIIIAATLLIAGLLVFIRPLAEFFGFENPYANDLLISMASGFICVIWYELVKWRKRSATTV